MLPTMLQRLISKKTEARKGSANRTVKLGLECLERREVQAARLSSTFDFIRSSSAFQKAEVRAIQTGNDQVIHINRSLGNADLENGFLRKCSKLAGTITGDVTIHPEKGSYLVETFKISEKYSGLTGIDDIKAATVNAEVSLTGNYQVSISKTKVGKVKSTDWRSEGNTSVIVQAGPLKGVDYQMTMLATSDRDFGDKVSGLTKEELVGSTIRNFSPIKTQLGDWITSGIDKLDKFKIPGVNVREKLSSYQILVDSFSGAKGRTDAQIFSDVSSNSSFIIGVNSDNDILRFAEGGVTSVIGVKFNYSKTYDLCSVKLPGAIAAPLFGGIVTVDLGFEAGISAGISLQGVLVADTRGYGLSEGTSASISLKVETNAVGNIAVIGFEKWSILNSETKVGLFSAGKISLIVGGDKAKYDQLVNGHLLYVTRTDAQSQPISSYLSSRFTATAGASFQEKVKILGITIWKKQKTKEWETYSDVLFSQKQPLGS